MYEFLQGFEMPNTSPQVKAFTGGYCAQHIPRVKIMPNAYQSKLLGAFDVNFARCSLVQDIFPGWKLSLLCSNRSREVPNNVKCSSTFLGALDKDCVSDCRGGMLLTIRILQAQSRSIGHHFRYLAQVLAEISRILPLNHTSSEFINACLGKIKCKQLFSDRNLSDLWPFDVISAAGTSV